MFPLLCFRLKSELWRQPIWRVGAVADSLLLAGLALGRVWHGPRGRGRLQAREGRVARRARPRVLQGVKGLDQLNSKGKQNVSVLASSRSPPPLPLCLQLSAAALSLRGVRDENVQVVPLELKLPAWLPTTKKKPTKIQKSPAQNALIIHQRCSSVSPWKSGSRCTPAWEFFSRIVMSRRLSLLVSFPLPMKSDFLMTLGAEAFPSWCSQLAHLFFSPNIMKPVIKLHGLAVTVWVLFMCQSSLNKSFIVDL